PNQAQIVIRESGQKILPFRSCLPRTDSASVQYSHLIQSELTASSRKTYIVKSNASQSARPRSSAPISRLWRNLYNALVFSLYTRSGTSSSGLEEFTIPESAVAIQTTVSKSIGLPRATGKSNFIGPLLSPFNLNSIALDTSGFIVWGATAENGSNWLKGLNCWIAMLLALVMVGWISTPT